MTVTEWLGGEVVVFVRRKQVRGRAVVIAFGAGESVLPEVEPVREALGETKAAGPRVTRWELVRRGTDFGSPMLAAGEPFEVRLQLDLRGLRFQSVAYDAQLTAKRLPAGKPDLLARSDGAAGAAESLELVFSRAILTAGTYRLAARIRLSFAGADGAGPAELRASRPLSVV